MCRKTPIDSKQINKKFAALLRKVLLICNECNQKLPYEEMVTKHFDECPRPKIRCPLECGVDDIKSIDHLAVC